MVEIEIDQNMFQRNTGNISGVVESVSMFTGFDSMSYIGLHEDVTDTFGKCRNVPRGFSMLLD